jgi:hypothetical protein
MPTPTYDLLASTTLAVASSSTSFTSISQDYGDLILTVSHGYADFRFNSDSGSNYSKVVMAGRSSGPASSSGTSSVLGVKYGSDRAGQITLQIMDYTATDKHKSCLLRVSEHQGAVEATAGRWANTAAINAIEVRGGTHPIGTVILLYGVAK